MVQHGLGRDSEDRPDRQVVQIPRRRVRPHLLEETGALPVRVGEENALRRALLARARVCVLVALPRDVIEVADVRTEYLPVESGILDLDLAFRNLEQVLGDLGTTGELSQTHVGVEYQPLGDRTTAVEEVHIPPVHAAIVQQSQELLHDQRALLGGLQHRLVPHEEGPHQLQDRYLQREVEGRDDGHGTVRPTVSVAELAVVIAGHAEGPGQETHVVAAEVLEEVGRDAHLSRGLGVGFGNGLDDGGREEVGDRRIAERFSRLRVRVCI